MDNTLTLNIPIMDKVHDEFLSLLSQLQSCEAKEFLALFEELIEHTKDHFAFEEDLMKEFDFYGKEEHMQEHSMLLDEMEYFYKKAEKMLPLGQSYINDYVHDKFKRHVMNIDSQFAMYLKEENIELLTHKKGDLDESCCISQR